MIKVENVCKSFDGVQVLKNVSAEFIPGKVNLIIGQSGSGKTVLMKSMIRLHTVDSGIISYDGIDIAKMKFRELYDVRKNLGMLFQGSALFDYMTVEENVIFPLEMFSDLSHEEQVKRVEFCLDHVGIAKNAYKRYPSELSGGMQKRVGIARAIALNPKYLFCDEPNSGIDPIMALKLDKLILDLTKEFNITTVVNTHDMNSVMEIGENIVFINKGEVSWKGTKEEIFHVDNEALNNFVFASEFYRDAKKAMIQTSIR